MNQEHKETYAEYVWRESPTTEACDHWVGVKRSGHYKYASDTSEKFWEFTYCPKCGVKL